jgi:hypothetical protein
MRTFSSISPFDHKVAPSLGGLWRVWFLFYGSFFLASGTLIYAVCCPANIKTYDTSFAAGDHAQYWRTLGHFDLLQKRIGAIIQRRSRLEAELIDVSHIQLQRPLGTYASQQEATAYLVMHLWMLENVSRPRLRLVVLALFAAGLTLVGLPAVVTFVQVCLLAVERLFL